MPTIGGVDCDEHGCLDVERVLASGIYGSTDNYPDGDTSNDDEDITAIEIDICGHICGIWFVGESSST